MADKYVYFFGEGKAEGDASMKILLGGKGANLAEMTNIKVPVPAGFTISTEVCSYYYENDRKYPAKLEKEVKENIARVEKAMGAKFGDPENPLLFSVRSGAPASMPGMMDTVLNLGLNEETLKGLIKKSGNERFAYDSYRRLVQMYGDVVMGLKPESEDEEDPFEVIIEKKKKELGIELDLDLTAEDLKDLADRFVRAIKERLGVDFPQDPMNQLWGAIGAVFGSWNNPRAITYRNLNKIPAHWGTAVNVQAMVFGNMGDDCATGVAFTRDPSTGENVFYGEYLKNAQGEDVVAGIRTPQPINRAKKREESMTSLEEEMPKQYGELVGIYKKLEKHYKEMQDIEFTIQNEKLWMLQTRTGKRTAQAAVRIAVEMVKEGLIGKEEAVLRLDPDQVDQLLHPMIDPKADRDVIAKGLPASPGAAVGKVVFTANDAEKEAKVGEKVILVRIETSPEDIHGMNAAQGILTARGGMTSHAAVVARGMGKPCVAGAGDIRVSYEKQTLTVGNRTIKRGDFITLDGSTGEVMAGEMPLVKAALSGDFGTLMGWVDGIRRLKVRTNADTPNDSQVAVDFGAEGIGLCRTEHMFFEGDRIDAVREMILADDGEARRKALKKIEPMQQGDFEGIFRVMKERPVTIRLLDPPLHEFLPHTDNEIKELSKKMGVKPESIKEKVEELHEFNPMLGHRGCRLGVIYPEISEMQATAIIRAACVVKKEGVDVHPEIMIPLVGIVKELELQREVVIKAAEKVFEEEGIKVDYLVGTMIELPRACLTADEIAKVAQFFSFGTNDLTQTTFGLSRDDAGSFLPEYVKLGILAVDPFVALDQRGVGELVEMAVVKGRSTRKDLKVGICGEHGGEPTSVMFCHKVGLNYVSCSPYRVPIARLAAAQAVIKEKRNK
ncbi:MAG: pyruvate, phosphate dikinase [Deltaproteobacteria bacterium]|uniref:Pyruvate, phosphate dikinase n=1 Tax=Candidatus Zymogenus saltonus TaxID=2844893 RepID=A0A9D8KHA2_9DELT|nr:pyruvate, phosphate dikinase [Candidatus Zymogenus saltonus]